jgi:BlaI family transcriptional regulator, penicillinase repressor
MPDPARLSRREREILDALFALGSSATAEDIRARLTDPPSSSAVRAMLAKLEAKGVIRHRAEGLRYVYTPTSSRASARRKALSNLVGVFFGGSPSEAASALLRHEAWTESEIEALRAEIDRVKRHRRQS